MRDNQRSTVDTRLQALICGGIFLLILTNQLKEAFSSSFIGFQGKIVDYPTEIHSSKASKSLDHEQTEKNNENDDDSTLITATDILLKRKSKNLPSNHATEIKFAPGSLEMNSTQVLQHCYTDPSVYEKHFFTRDTRPIMYSDEHRLIYIMLPKSGSSTAKYTLKKYFQAGERPLWIKQMHNITGKKGLDGYHIFSFVREPLGRFYSQYDEVFMRLAPWAAKGEWSHPYPYLYEGMSSGQDYKDTWCPKDLWDATHECRENGTLAGRMERFVSEYSGLDPFDIHLQLQVPLLTFQKTGRPYPSIELYNLTNIQAGWESVAQHAGVDFAEKKEEDKKNITTSDGKAITIEKRRTVSRRVDVSKLSNATKQRICEMTLLDYCCLNMPLPPPCQNLHCKLSKHSEKGKEEWLVQPWSFPNEKNTRSEGTQDR